MKYDVYLGDDALKVAFDNNLRAIKVPTIEKLSWIYFLLDKDSNVVYVGQSYNHPALRVFCHQKAGKKFSFYKAILIDDHYNPDKMNNFEAEFIFQYNPIYNKVLPRNKRWANLTQAKEFLGMTKHKVKKFIKQSPVTIETRMYDSKIFFSYEQLKSLVCKDS
jgi:hypothetical protein